MELSYTKHDVILGRKEASGLSNVKIAGFAKLNDGEAYYTLKLMMFPEQTYFIVKNKNSHDRYTVFSKKIEDGDQVVFRHPVGSGQLSLEAQSYLEIYFPLTRSQVFMNLYPSKFNE